MDHRFQMHNKSADPPVFKAEKVMTLQMIVLALKEDWRGLG